MIKRITIALLCIALLTPALGCGAELISPGNVPDSILANSLPVASMMAGCANVQGVQFTALTDNNPITVWNAAEYGLPTTDAPYLIINLDSPSAVEAIWLRNGSAASAESFAANGYPTRVDVYLWAQDSYGNLQQAGMYAYRMEGKYNPYEYSAAWQYGYQCLRLPQVAERVSSIVLYVTEHALQGAGNTVCVSDALVTGTAYSAPQPSIAPTEPPATATPVPKKQPFEATLLRKIATRSGPGTFLKAGDTVEVISIAYDENDVAWVQVDFTVGKTRRRAYTGLSRIDAEAWQIPVEKVRGNRCVLDRNVTPRMGPGKEYVSVKDTTLRSGTPCTLILYEGEWAMIELTLENQPVSRMWVPRTSLYVW